MTSSHDRLRQIPRQNCETRPKLIPTQNDADRAELASHHYQEPAVRNLPESEAQAKTGMALDEALGSDSSKWPNRLVTVSVVIASLLLWLVIVGTIRQIY